MQRGDSLDTIFASSPPPDNEREIRVKSKTKKRNSPRRRRQLEQQQQESTDQETTLEPPPLPLLRNSPSMIIDNVTGNITQLSDSVILNIDTSSDTSSSIDDYGQEEEEEDLDDDIPEGLCIQINEIKSHFDPILLSTFSEDEDDLELEIDDDLQSDNWEIRMLAAELNRRESRRDEPLSSEGSEAHESSSGARQLQMRSDTLDTDTENSELETDRVQRPRAASFDQQSLPRQRNKGILKAFSFDRDKDQL